MIFVFYLYQIDELKQFTVICFNIIFNNDCRTKQAVKHMKIFEVNPTNDDNQYFLSNTRYFKSISDLVNLYEDVSLMENYEG